MPKRASYYRSPLQRVAESVRRLGAVRELHSDSARRVERAAAATRADPRPATAQSLTDALEIHRERARLLETAESELRTHIEAAVRHWRTVDG